MIEVDTTTRRWGNSIGIALPKDIVKKAKIKPNRNIKIFIPEKRVNLEAVFGSLKITRSTQEIIDDIREGED